MFIREKTVGQKFPKMIPQFFLNKSKTYNGATVVMPLYYIVTRCWLSGGSGTIPLYNNITG